MQSSLPNLSPLLFPNLSHLHGPESRRLLRRTARSYAALFGMAVALLQLAPATWSGFALGLMAPGAGFALGWAMLASVVLFGVAVLIWFATGNVLLAPLVWLGTAWLAAGSAPSPAQILAVPALIALLAAGLRFWQRHVLHRAQNHRARFNAHLAACPALAAALVTALGLGLQFSAAEWARTVFAVALVFIAELLNTALEHLCDVISPGPNPSIGKAKDIAAGAVLIAALAACAVLATILLPRLLPAAGGLCGGG